jgi:hypothetical protein
VAFPTRAWAQIPNLFSPPTTPKVRPDYTVQWSFCSIKICFEWNMTKNMNRAQEWSGIQPSARAHYHIIAGSMTSQLVALQSVPMTIKYFSNQIAPIHLFLESSMSSSVTSGYLRYRMQVGYALKSYTHSGTRFFLNKPEKLNMKERQI